MKFIGMLLCGWHLVDRFLTLFPSLPSMPGKAVMERTTTRKGEPGWSRIFLQLCTARCSLNRPCAKSPGPALVLLHSPFIFPATLVIYIFTKDINAIDIEGWILFCTWLLLSCVAISFRKTENLGIFQMGPFRPSKARKRCSCTQEPLFCYHPLPLVCLDQRNTRAKQVSFLFRFTVKGIILSQNCRLFFVDL